MNDERTQRLYKLFECVVHEVMASGGDGDGFVGFRSTPVEEVAAAFEAWRASQLNLKHWLPHRVNRDDGSVLFTDMSNENLTFMKAPVFGVNHPFKPEVVMEVW